MDEHFQNHVKLVERFRDAGPEAVARMWKSQTNEGGHSLSQFERDALIERYCELFGTWPDRSGLRAAELDRADLCIVKAKQHILDQRRRLAEQEYLGRDTRLSKRVLLSLERTLLLMIGYRDMLGSR